VRHFLV